jgi:hypothetical protein
MALLLVGTQRTLHLTHAVFILADYHEEDHKIVIMSADTISLDDVMCAPFLSSFTPSSSEGVFTNIALKIGASCPSNYCKKALTRFLAWSATTWTQPSK